MLEHGCSNSEGPAQYPSSHRSRRHVFLIVSKAVGLQLPPKQPVFLHCDHGQPNALLIAKKCVRDTFENCRNVKTSSLSPMLSYQCVFKF